MTTAEDATPPTEEPALPEAVRYRWSRWTLPALALLVAGVLLAILTSGGQVESVLVARNPGISGVLPSLGKPDYYIVVVTSERSVQTEPYVDVPIGNGLTWQLAEPVPLAEIQEIELRDRNLLLGDGFLDRVRIDGWAAEGQSYSFTLHGRSSAWRMTGIVLAFLGGAVTLLCAGRFLRDQVV